MNDHVSVEDLAAFVDGRLAIGRRAELESHFSRCGECLEALAEIVDLQGSRAMIPGEFLRQALGEKQAVRKRVLPMRLAFEIAAAFLVVVVIGYFFLGGSRLRQTAGPQKEKADASAARPVRQTPPVSEKKHPALVGGVARGGAAGSDKMPLEKKAETAAVPALDTGGKKDRAAVVREEKSSLAAGNELREQGQDQAALPAWTETDKMSDVQIEPSRSAPAPEAPEAAQPALATQSRTAMPKKKGEANVVTPDRARETEAHDEESFHFPAREAAAIARARQLFLAAAGRPVAPGGIKMAAPARSRFHIEGDVAWSDLRNSELLDGWSWFREGLILELQVDGAGEVSAVVPVGPWERSLAETAVAAARQLTFSASARKSRRARISVFGSSPN